MKLGDGLVELPALGIHLPQGLADDGVVAAGLGGLRVEFGGVGVELLAASQDVPQRFQGLGAVLHVRTPTDDRPAGGFDRLRRLLQAGQRLGLAAVVAGQRAVADAAVRRRPLVQRDQFLVVLDRPLEQFGFAGSSRPAWPSGLRPNGLSGGSMRRSA